MSDGTQINAAELQEMARVMLCEIYGARKLQNEGHEPDYSERASRNVFRTGSVLDSFGRQSSGFAVDGGFQRKLGNSGENEGFYPRTSRGEFLEQRLQRRRQRQEPFGSTENSSTEAEDNALTLLDNLTQFDLPEKLSDNFCRDARRYDGTFERY